MAPCPRLTTVRRARGALEARCRRPPDLGGEPVRRPRDHRDPHGLEQPQRRLEAHVAALAALELGDEAHTHVSLRRERTATQAELLARALEQGTKAVGKHRDLTRGDS